MNNQPSSQAATAVVQCPKCAVYLTYPTNSVSIQCSACGQQMSPHGYVACVCGCLLSHPPSAQTIQCPKCEAVCDLKTNTSFVSSSAASSATPTELAKGARQAARTLAGLPSDMRRKILLLLAQRLCDNATVSAILAANQADLQAAATAHPPLSNALQSRLRLTAAKLSVLAAGITQMANSSDPLHRLVRHTQLADGLELQQETVPIGVLLGMLCAFHNFTHGIN